MTTVSLDRLTSMIAEILRGAQLDASQADALAQVLAAAERDGCKSHGIFRLPGALRTLKAGKVVADAVPVVIADAPAVIRMDARGGFSNLAFAIGMPMLVARARALGLAALVINDCTHISALWYEVEALANLGVAGLAMCPSYATVAPVGGTKPLLGTNPFAFGWPRPKHNAYVFDFATSVVARGEIELYRQAGKPLPEGWAMDAEGVPTTDPSAALSGAMLPFGAHKGSAISTMIELLAGAMIGDLTSAEALDWLGSTTLTPKHGELILAFDPVAFASRVGGDPFPRAEALLDAITAQGARLPSQRRYAARAVTLRDGIALTADEVMLMERLAREGLAAV